MDGEAYVAPERFPLKGDIGDSHQNTAKTRSGFFPLNAAAKARGFLKLKCFRCITIYREFLFTMTNRNQDLVLERGLRTVEKAERSFLGGLVIFWLFFAADYFLYGQTVSNALSVSMRGMLWGSFFSIANFHSWRKLLVGFLSKEALELSGAKNSRTSVLLGLFLKTTIVLVTILLALKANNSDILGFLLSFTSFLLLGLFLMTLSAFRQRALE